MLTTTTEHTLRVLTLLAETPSDSLVSGDTLARRGRVPRPYLPKIMAALAGAGFVLAVRGAGGGYRLTVPPGSISLKDVAEMFDPSPPRARCLLGGGRWCSNANACGAHAQWAEVRSAVDRYLTGTTIASLMSPRSAKRRGGRGRPKNPS
jgi:Rrf2 family iron-sulfur cluster assembly transcriptional regulator